MSQAPRPYTTPSAMRPASGFRSGHELRSPGGHNIDVGVEHDTASVAAPLPAADEPPCIGAFHLDAGKLGFVGEGVQRHRPMVGAPWFWSGGSLATLLWRERCKARGLSVPAIKFAAVGLGGVPLIILGTWAALLVTG